ncbi:MAG: VWA domain-containing protein, partial [Acidobacteria bacterium]|nr:VWA domain-containing protein [Acidobacteriota bacterium]
MNFANPWVLLLVPLLLPWLAYEWRRAIQHRTRLVLKAVTFCLVLLALAQPRVTYSNSRMAVALLVDTSASVSNADLDRAAGLVNDIQKERGSNWTIAIPFARGTRRVADTERKGGWRFQHTAGEAGRSTDLEAAIREALGAMPPGRVPRLVLISDGKENRGSVARGGWQARELGIPVDTYALAGKPKPALHLDSVTMPAIAYSGDRFPIDLMVSSPRSAQGTVEISVEGKSLGTNHVEITEGANQLRVHANLSASGAIEVSGVVKAPGLGEVEFARAIALHRPKILYVSDDPAAAEKHFTEMLTSSQFDVDR